MRSSLACLAILAILPACHSEPTPVPLSIAPTVICNGADTTITVTGKDFRQTPTIGLTGAAGSFAVAPADVTFVSETQLTFVARAQLAIAAGVYDVVVTNPAGHKGALAQALTVVAEPGLVSISKPAVCDTAPGSITITGTMFRDDPTTGPFTVTLDTSPPTVLSEANGEVVFVDAQTLTVNLPGSLPDGVYALTVKDALGCSETISAALTVAPPTTITGVAPVAAWSGADTTITLTGTHFRATPTVTLSAAAGTPISLTMVTLVDAQTVTAVVPQGTPTGSYTLTLTDPDGCAATFAFTVTNIAPVTINKVIVPFGCSTGPTPITIDGMNFVSTPSAVLVAAGTAGADLPLQNVAFVSSTRLTALVPAGGKIGGPYDLKLTNGDGGTTTKAMVFTITELCPPIIDDVTPTSVVHDYKTAIASPISITGSNFRSDATVVLVNQAGVEAAFPNATLTITTNLITLNFDASVTNLTDGIYILRVKEADAATGVGGTGATEWGDFSLFIVTNPSGKFQMSVAAKALPTPRRGHGVVGGQNNAAARYHYANAGDGGSATPTLFADGLFARLDVFGNIGDAGWQRLRKRAAAPATGDTGNDLPSARTGIAIAQRAGWVYAIGGTTAVGTGAAPTPAVGGPLSEVQRAHILSAADAPTLTASTTAGGTIAAGTYYYRVSMLLATATPGYGAAVAETVASDEQVVGVSAGQKVHLAFAQAGSSTVPGGKIAGYRVYRSVMANGVSQSEVWLADVVTVSNTGSYDDDGSGTPAGAHPIEAGMLSAWEATASLQIPRAYASATLATPPTAGGPNLYVVGGWSGATASAAETTWEYAVINGTDATLGTFGPAGLSLNGATNCTIEQCMAGARWALFSSTVADPASVTNVDTRWILAGAGAADGTSEIQEHAQVAASGLLGAWSKVTTGAGGAFTTASNTLGPIGFYTNAHVAIVDGYAGATVSNKDEFGTEACSVALVSGACPLGADFKQTAKSSSTLGISPAVAFSGYTLTSGYVFVVGGSTNGTDATTKVSQGAQ